MCFQYNHSQPVVKRIPIGWFWRFIGWYCWPFMKWQVLRKYKKSNKLNAQKINAQVKPTPLRGSAPDAGRAGVR